MRIISDYCGGELLYDYVNRKDINKTQIYGLIRGLVSALDNYREAAENCTYGSVNPYNVLITKEGEVFLLDMNEKSNDFVDKKMQSNLMRQNFDRAYNKVCVESKVADDIFTFAVTVGYIMATVSERLKFSMFEQKKLMKVVSRCIGERRKVYIDFEFIKRDLKICIDEDYRRVQKKTTAVITIFILLLVILSFVLASF